MDVAEHFKSGRNAAEDVVNEMIPSFLGDQGINSNVEKREEKKNDVLNDYRKEKTLNVNDVVDESSSQVPEKEKQTSAYVENTDYAIFGNIENVIDDKEINKLNEIGENSFVEENEYEESDSDGEFDDSIIEGRKGKISETLSSLTVLGESEDTILIKRRNKQSPDVNIHKIMSLVAKDPSILKRIYALKENNKCLCYYPLLTPYHHIKKLVDILIDENYEYENTWTVHWDAKFVARLLYEGLIPVASKLKVKKFVNGTIVKCDEPLLIPKIHFVRSCMHPSEIHISKKVKKLCKNFYITIDKDFDGVINGIIEKHGENWLYPFIQKEFKKLFEKTETYKNLEMHSVEVWFGDELVAGEIGNSIGAVYTSLTGFQRKNCAGTIQLCALAKLLEYQNFQLWDLGMLLPYKKDIGSKEVAMKDFFVKHRRYKHQQAEFKVPFREKLNCSVLIRGANVDDFD